MRLAVLSDIHSNNVALEVCIEYINHNRIDGVILLGDYVSDCPNPQCTLAHIKDLKEKYQTWSIRGNREEYFVDYHDKIITGWKYSSYKGSLLYTYELLTEEDIEGFRDLPHSMIIEIPGTDPITIAHGSPDSARELLDIDKENTKDWLRKISTNYILCGHTHRQVVYSYKDKLLINPGSVGVAIGAKATAHFAILEWNETSNLWDYELKAIPYNLERLHKLFDESDLIHKAYIWPKCILKSVETGINYGPICAKNAYDLAIAKHEVIYDRIVPEIYWEQAAIDLQIIEPPMESYYATK